MPKQKMMNIAKAVKEGNLRSSGSSPTGMSGVADKMKKKFSGAMKKRMQTHEHSGMKHLLNM